VVLAHAEEVEAEAVGEDRLLDHVAEHPGLAHGTPVRVDGDVPEGVEAELEASRRLGRRGYCSPAGDLWPWN